MGQVVFDRIKGNRSVNGFEIKTEQQLEHTEKPINMAVHMVTLYMAAVSFWYGFLSVFRINVEPAVVYISLIFPVLIWSFIFRKRKGRVPAVLLTVFVCLLLGFSMQSYLADGFRHIANVYITLHNEFYTASQPLFAEMGSAGCMLAVVMIQMMLTAVLAAVLRARRCILVAIAFIFLPFLLAATVGYMPSAPSGWLIIGSGLLYVLVYSQTNLTMLKREVLTAGCLYTAVVLFASLIQPLILESRNGNKEEYIRIHDKLVEAQQLDLGEAVAERFRGSANYSVGGIGKGDLRNLAENRPQGSKDMEIVMEEAPPERLYLKAYVGSEYTGKKWEEPSARDFKRMLRSAGAAGKGGELFGEPYKRLEEGQDNITPLQMQVRLTGASDEFAYAPYFVNVTENDSVYADAYIQGRGKTERVYSFFPRIQAAALYRGELGEETEIWKAYEEYVEEAYTTKAQGLEKLEKYCSDMDTRSLNAVKMSIDEKFNDSLKYTREPGRYPSDEDFTEHFLLESRRGFCVHFATAATLIYRECDYPSRYVEGYAVPPSAFKMQEDGSYKAEVTDGMAHAWCETFQPGIGWKVQEHTLPFSEDEDWTTEVNTEEPENHDAGDAPDENEQQQEEQETPANQAEQGQSPEAPADAEDTNGENIPVPTEGKNGNEKNGAAAGGQRVLPKLAAGAALLFVFAFSVLLLCVVQQKIRMQKKRYGFRVKTQNQGIKNIFRAVYKIAVFAAPKERELNDRETLQWLQERFTELTEEEWEWLYDCALRAAFAEGQLEKAEQQKMYGLYKKFRKAVLSGLTVWRKFVFVFVKGL